MGKIYIYLFDDLDALGDEFVANNFYRLPACRQQYCAKYQQIFDRDRCLLAYLLLEKGLKEHFAIDQPLEFTYNHYGKPYLKDIPNIYFNMSHCKCGVVCALADCEIGVDIQEVRPFEIDIARRVCSESEIQQLLDSDDPARLFCRIWTKKESFAKAKGASVADVLKLELPHNGFFVKEYTDYCVSLFRTKYQEENDIDIIGCQLPL